MCKISFTLKVFISVILCLSSGIGYSQTITADVGGTVTDPAGLVVGGAKVTATNIDTGVAVSATTNAQGIYSIRFLQVGRYRITVDQAGFRKEDIGPFTLESGQIAKVDSKLTVGADTSTVEVSGTYAPLLNAENGTLDAVIDSNTIENMPLNGENFNTVTLFLPGSVETNPTAFTGSDAVERSTNANDTASINGGRLQQNNFLLDGVEINETINNTVGYNPYPDALSEIRVISADAPAEFGNVNGGDVLMLTKSGTDQFHGSASFNLEDYLLDANTWGNKHVLPGTAFTPRGPYTQSIFGGTLGGPVFKHKLFFFADFLATRFHSGGTTPYTVLSTAMRTGDFSELLNPLIMCSSTGGVCTKQSSLIQLYDPENGNAAFPNNKIPISNPVYAYLVAHPALYPLPNHAPGSNSPVSGNFVGSTSTREYNEQGDVKIDYTPTAKDRYSVRYTQGQAGGFSTSQILTTFPGLSTYPDKGVAINWVRTITPALVNEFRAGFTRIRWESGIPTDPSGVFGLSGDSLVGIPFAQPYPGFASQTTSNTSLSNIGTSGSPTIIIDNTFSYSEDLTWQHGKHLIKGGVQLLRYQQNQFYAGNQGAMGIFTYNGNFTSNAAVIAANSPAAPSGSGYDIADFALDRVYTEGVGAVKGNTGQRQWRDAYFAQDDWKVTPKLTLNLGVRYEYDQPIYEVNNKQANVLPGGIVEFAGSVPANAPAGSVVCPTRACYDATYDDFAPRLGFAYQTNPRLVVRGGFGTTDYLEGTGANLRLFYNPPFEPSFLVTGSAPSTTGGGVYYQTTAGFNLSTLALGGATYRQWQQHLHPGVINEFSLTTEYQLSNFASFRIGYIGESGQHLILAGAGNQLTTPCVLNGAISNAPTSAACAAVDPAPYYSLVGQNGSIVTTESRGMMNYNALQATYRQRATKGLEFTVNYTYGRAMTNTIGFFGVPSISGSSAYAENYYNNHAEYGPAGQDVRHNLNGTGVYALPFGRGRTYGANMNRILDEVAGGWKVDMTAVVYSGFPVTINANTNDAYQDNNAQRANQVTNARFHTHTIANWWGGSDTTTIQAKYVEPPVGTFGNAAVGSERGPGYQQYDMSFFKDFTVYHEQRIGFRADMFNAFNISSLGAPTRTQGSTTIGQITSARSPNRQIQFSAKYQF